MGCPTQKKKNQKKEPKKRKIYRDVSKLRKARQEKKFFGENKVKERMNRSINACAKC